MSTPTTDSLQAEVQDRFGVLPNFFCLASDAPEITANLWGFAKFGYLDNPLPSLFKERLFVYLSRFCDVRYCIARHVGFLVGLGRPSGDRQCPPETVEQVVRLVRRPLPRGDDLESSLTLLEGSAPLLTPPGSDTPIEAAVFACATHVFLQTSQAARCLHALQHVFDGALVQHLIVFLAFVRTAHYWTKFHPELGFEDDVKQLFATHEALAECVLNDPEAACESTQVILDELHSLRQEHARREEMERALEERWPTLGAAAVPTWAKGADATRTLLSSIVESSDDAIISKDLNGIITSWNRAAQRVFGYTVAEAVGQPVTLLIPPARHDEEPDILARVKRGERIDHYETVRRRKDGTLVDVSLVVSPIFDAAGNVIGVSKVARDITDRRRSEEIREELLNVAEGARVAAEAASRAKDEFLAMLGHELRNPLSAVRNAIAAATLDERSRGRALVIARRQTDQLGKIVDDLLDVTRISQGNIRLRKERVVLAELLQRTIDGAQAIMVEKGHELTLSASAEAIHVQGDASRLEQAIGNLLANAAKYTDPGGSVAVIAERDGTQVVIRVRDNGIGIAPETLPRVFDLFTQAARSLDRSAGGLGIGLTLARRIVELHGGTVEARSAGLGAGAEFIIRLPMLQRVMDDATAKFAEESHGRLSKGIGARILMVEDHPDAAESLLILLELLGHHVRVVHDGVAALGAARANPPEVMLIDIGLPGMNGYEVAQAIRRDPTLKHLMLVALTGYGQPEDAAAALAAGFDYHLVKPVDLDALGRLVERLTSSAERETPTRH